MSRMVRCQLWIAATAGAIFFTNLGAAALFDMDEALYATCAARDARSRQRDRTVVQRGDVSREAAADVLDDDGRIRVVSRQ